MTTLDTLIEQKREEMQSANAQRQAEQQQREQEAAALMAERIALMEAELRAELGEVYTELPTDYSTDVFTDYTWWEVKATLLDPVSRFKFQIARRYKNTPDRFNWELRWYSNGDSRRFDLASGKLLSKLVGQIVEARSIRTRLDAEEAAEAEADRVDAEIRARIATVEAEARASAWQWPAGKSVTVYVMQYCTGAILNGDEGTVQADYRTVYTLTDELDERGYITVFDRGYASFTQEDIRLSLAYHKPTWTRLTLTGLDDVPHQILTEDIKFTVHGVRESTHYRDNRFVYDDQAKTFRVASSNAIPAQWLRDLVDRA